MDGRGYLESLIAKRISQATSSSEPSPAIDRSEIRGIAEGLAVAGVLTTADKDDLLVRFDRTLVDAGLMQVRRIEMKATPNKDERIRMALAASQSNRSVDIQPSDAQPTADTPQLVRVVPLHGRVVESADGRMVLVSLEIWSQYVTLRVGYLDSRVSGADRMINHRKWHGEDDAHTRYTESHSYWSDSHGCVLETRVFTPGAPAGAAILVLQSETSEGTSSLSVPLGVVGGPACCCRA